MSGASVSVIGAGLMGSAIATRLLEAGCDVRVFDLDPAKVAALVEKGGGAAASVAEATRASRLSSSASTTPISFEPSSWVTGELLKMFTGRVHHHVFEACSYEPVASSDDA